MSMRLQIIIIVGMLLVLFYIIGKVRKKQLDLRYALGWMIVDVCILVLTIWPVLLVKLSSLLGIASPVNMLFFFGICFLVMIIFGQSISISNLSEKVKKLSQEVAILRRDTYDQINEVKEQEKKS